MSTLKGAGAVECWLLLIYGQCGWRTFWFLLRGWGKGGKMNKWRLNSLHPCTNVIWTLFYHLHQNFVIKSYVSRMNHLNFNIKRDEFYYTICNMQYIQYVMHDVCNIYCSLFCLFFCVFVSFLGFVTWEDPQAGFPVLSGKCHG